MHQTSDAHVHFVKSTHSGTGDCVEWSHQPGGDVLVRHSQDPEGALLRFTRTEWAAFVAGVRDGEADGP